MATEVTRRKAKDSELRAEGAASPSATKEQNERNPKSAKQSSSLHPCSPKTTLHTFLLSPGPVLQRAPRGAPGAAGEQLLYHQHAVLQSPR